MSSNFNYRSFFRSLEVKILPTGVEVIKRSFFNYDEFQIDFDQFTTKKTIRREVNHGVLFLVAAFSLVTFFNFISGIGNPSKSFGSAIIFLIITLFLSMIAYLSRKQVVSLLTLYDQQTLELPYSKKNEQEVREFADGIIEKTKEFLISKYANVDKDLPRESQLENLISLKDRSIITEREFERLKNMLLDKDPEKKIGF
jgi:hypothetical protein